MTSNMALRVCLPEQPHLHVISWTCFLFFAFVVQFISDVISLPMHANKYRVDCMPKESTFHVRHSTLGSVFWIR